jgi:hypothetical protein
VVIVRKSCSGGGPTRASRSGGSVVAPVLFIGHFASRRSWDVSPLVLLIDEFLFEIRVDKSWQESNEIRIPFDLDKHIHGPIYAETFHFLRDFIVIVIMSQKLISEQCYTFSLKPTRVLHQPQKCAGQSDRTAI